MSFTVDADGDQGTLPLPKFKPKDSWMTNTSSHSVVGKRARLGNFECAG